MVENLTSEVSVPEEDNRYFSFNLFGLTSTELWESTRVSSHRSISKQILSRGYHSIKLRKEGQKDLQSPRYSTWILDHKFIRKRSQKSIALAAHLNRINRKHFRSYAIHKGGHTSS